MSSDSSCRGHLRTSLISARSRTSSLWESVAGLFDKERYFACSTSGDCFVFFFKGKPFGTVFYLCLDVFASFLLCRSYRSSFILSLLGGPTSGLHVAATAVLQEA